MKYSAESVTPKNNQVLIERLPVVEETESGIMIPDTGRIQSLEPYATVLKIGPGKLRWSKTMKRWIRIPIEGIQSGDRVIIERYAGVTSRPPSELDDLLLLVDADDIIGVVE